VAEVKDVPVPPQKPEPPKKKKVEKKDDKKPVNDEQDMNSLVDKLAKEQTAALPPPQEEVPAQEPETEGIPQRLPAGEEDALRNYIRQCWSWPGGSEGQGELVVTLEIKLRPDATLLDVVISNSSKARMGDPVYRSFAESTKRAVQKCGVNGQTFPINLQRDYAVWGYIKANFRPTDFN
jgi:outer membrane biosynthesis protein TonB